MVVIAYFTALSFHWQVQAKDQLRACIYAQDYLEKMLIDKAFSVPSTKKVEEGSYTIVIITEKHVLPAGLPQSTGKISLSCIKVVVSWVNDRGDEQAVRIQSFC